MPVKAPIILFSVLLLAVFAGPVTVLAHGSAEGIVKERMESMELMGKAMKYVGGMVRGNVQADMNTVEEAAQTIIRHGERLPALFPDGSNRGPSEASPRIWQAFGQFEESTDKMIAAARALSSAAQTNDLAQVENSHKALGRTCGDCHRNFRIKQTATDRHQSIWSRMTEKVSEFFDY